MYKPNLPQNLRKRDLNAEREPKSNKPSMTQPDQALTIREILQRHTRNIPMNIQVKVPEYSDEYTPDLKSLDLTDIERMQDENEETILKYKQELEEKQKKKREDELETYYKQRKQQDDESNQSLPTPKPGS